MPFPWLSSITSSITTSPNTAGDPYAWAFEPSPISPANPTTSSRQPSLLRKDSSSSPHSPPPPYDSIETESMSPENTSSHPSSSSYAYNHRPELSVNTHQAETQDDDLLAALMLSESAHLREEQEQAELIVALEESARLEEERRRRLKEEEERRRQQKQQQQNNRGSTSQAGSRGGEGGGGEPEMKQMDQRGYIPSGVGHSNRIIRRAEEETPAQQRFREMLQAQLPSPGGSGGSGR